MTDRRLRVLHVLSPQPPGQTGGVDRHVYELVVAQAASGRIVPQVAELGAKGFAAQCLERGIRAHTLVDPYRLSIFGDLARLLVREAIDLVHTHGYDADLVGVGGWLVDRRRRPVVSTVHGLIWRPARNALKTIAMLASLAVGARCVVTTSNSRTPWLRMALPATYVRYVPNGVSIPATVGQDRSRSRHTPLLAYVGRLSSEKRVDLVLAACLDLVRSLPNVGCRIIGSGDDEPRLRHLAEQLEVGERIEFVGLQGDIAAALRGVDTLLLLSDTEGTPRAVIEAMALGVPVVATDVGGVGDLIRHGREGLLVPAGNSAAAAAAVRLLTTRPVAAQRMAAAARRRYQREFTIFRMEQRIARTYRDATAGRRR